MELCNNKRTKILKFETVFDFYWHISDIQTKKSFFFQLFFLFVKLTQIREEKKLRSKCCVVTYKVSIFLAGTNIQSEWDLFYKTKVCCLLFFFHRIFVADGKKFVKLLEIFYLIDFFHTRGIFGITFKRRHVLNTSIVINTFNIIIVNAKTQFDHPGNWKKNSWS